MVSERALIKTGFFARYLCKKLKIKFYSKKINVPGLAKKSGLSDEMAGRNARYEYFEELSKIHKFTKIATGHTFDDNIETILLNIVRGTGLAGLTGIPSKARHYYQAVIGNCQRRLAEMA